MGGNFDDLHLPQRRVRTKKSASSKPPLILPHSSMPVLPVIPQELFDMIIDFLHNDVAALCSAGLVCKSWLHASRFHLFSYLELSALIVHNVNGWEVICAEGSTIPPYILELRIEGDGSQFLDKTLLHQEIREIQICQYSTYEFFPAF